jgi:nucleoside-diphosphate-sugar epimerase
MEPNIVLVTGGSGMLGQQVVKHIDMFVKGVTEIRDYLNYIELETLHYDNTH